MIRLLDERTIGQIAAGEVVERPVSVVKELVENALDAGATQISVEIDGGGLDRIEVRDDGAGIPPDQIALALRRHATSKLRDADGLTGIATLGFRGEGLASVAAIAKTRVISRVAGDEVATAVEAFGEEVSNPERVAAPLGSTVVVRDLFANVPVRREFLRGAPAEFGRIASFLATLALGYPQVRFTLSHDGRQSWALAATMDLAERLALVFGSAQARALLPIGESFADGGIALRGFISRPGFDRPDRRMQLLFVNGRLLRTTLLAGAWSAGYATFAMTQRQPFGVLFLTLAPDAVDANVHPTKSDVRLRYPTRVGDRVRRAIAATLEREARSRVHTALSFAPPGSPSPDGSFNEFAPAFAANGYAPADGVSFFEDTQNGQQTQPLRILAQLDDTFILATDGAALVLVDQHAAHERVAFEEIAKRAASDRRSEPLLVPLVIELDAPRSERLETVLLTLLEAGLEIEPFGERTYRIIATPAGYGARAFDLRDYVDDLNEDIRGLSARERVWASLACHSVARAGDRLELAEMSALLARLVRCENPAHCPHGRPTIVRVEADAIARMFKRV